LNGLCITDAEKWFGVTSKTLCYYERVGLLEAIRADNNNYRYYDDSEVERIKQIMLLRKMQISIKDIIRIYENEDMSMNASDYWKRNARIIIITDIMTIRKSSGSSKSCYSGKCRFRLRI